MNETNHPARRLRHGDRPTEPLTFEDAAANKAAEEGVLPELPKANSLGWNAATASVMGYTQDDMQAYASHAIAADRASRQVANKADGEPTLWVQYIDGEKTQNVARDAKEKAMIESIHRTMAPGTKMEWQALYATPPAATGASTAQTIDTREFRSIMELAAAQFHRTEVFVQDLPSWPSIINHIDAKIAEASAPASTVLTDERIAEIASANSDVPSFARAIERETLIGMLMANDSKIDPVAAQAGQVAVPGWIDIDATEPPEHELIALRYWPYGNSENPQAVTGGRYIDGTYYNDEGDEMHPPSHWCRLPYFDAEATAKASTSGERQEGGAA